MIFTSKSPSDRLFCSPGRHHKAHAIVAVDAAGGPELGARRRRNDELGDDNQNGSQNRRKMVS